jgi:hypothetical protein
LFRVTGWIAAERGLPSITLQDSAWNDGRHFHAIGFGAVNARYFVGRTGNSTEFLRSRRFGKNADSHRKNMERRAKRNTV